MVPVSPDGVGSRDGYLVRRFRPRVEIGFARIEWWVDYERTRNHWRVISRENITHVFGFTPSARIADPADADRVFQWLLECSFDDKGNAIVYQYKAEDLVGVDASLVSEAHRLDKYTSIAGSHVESIAYGNREPFFADHAENYWPAISTLIESARQFYDHWQFRMVFDYTAREKPTDMTLDNRLWSVRPDPFSSYRAGFEIRTYRLCRRVLFESNIAVEIEGRETGYVGITHGLRFEYETESPNQQGPAGSAVLTKLKSIQQAHFCRVQDRSHDETFYEAAEWPPLEFEYSTAEAMELKQIPHGDAPSFPEGVDGARFEWVDLDGEGIQGVLSRRNDSWWYAPNRWGARPSAGDISPNSEVSGGMFEPQRPLRLQPAAAVGSPVAQLLDLAGDGTLDVLEVSHEPPLVYARDDEESWRPPRALPRPPAYFPSDPNIRLIDLDGDGRAELLLTEDDSFVWQESLGDDGFGAVHRVAMLLDEKQGPRCVFSEAIQTIFLADMSGDGLTDIVRIRNGEVCYWPNLGYGRFGARVTMDNAPVFDRSAQFDPTRLRLFDVDGSGTTDIVYLGLNGAAYWANYSGNGLSSRRNIPLPVSHSFASVSATDFFGRGTGCLVWSSPAPGDAGGAFRVVDLTGGVKPHLLTLVRNNLGAETAFSYRSSTEFYLEDLAEGRPWITKLPFPVHVVEKIETRDLIGRNRFVSRYAYHHGFFDGVEREFRGFGMVEQWDTEEIGSLSQPPDTHNWETHAYVPPTLTKTWFHHGAYLREKTIVAQFKREYWSGDSQAIDLSEILLPAGLTADEEREACRALRGYILRQETFSLEANEDAPQSLKARTTRPYEVIEHSHTVRALQVRGDNRHAVFFVHPRESLHLRYERTDPPDPRVAHELTLKVDAYGNVEQSVAIGYGRRQPEPADTDKNSRQALSGEERIAQRRTLITFTISSYTNAIEAAPDTWRTPLPAELRTYELTDPDWQKSTALAFRTIQQAITQWEAIPEIAYEATPSYTRRERRLIAHTLSLYRSNDLKSLLPLGELQSLALPGDTQTLAMTPGLAEVYESKASTDEVAAYLRDPGAGYTEPAGDGNFWVSVGRTYFSPNASGTPQGSSAELAFARKRFFLPHRFVDPFGNATRVAYDDAILRIAEITDPAGNTTRAVYDYRVLQPKLLTDANVNHVAVAFDTRGLVVATAVLGKTEPEGEFGDTLEGLEVNPNPEEVKSFFADPIAKAPSLLAAATTRFVYDVMRFYRAAELDKPTSPIFAAALERKFHVNLPFADDAAARLYAGLQNFALADQIQCRFSYSDGFGREIQQKTRTSPKFDDSNPPPTKPQRWLGSGWTIFNNKGTSDQAIRAVLHRAAAGLSASPRVRVPEARRGQSCPVLRPLGPCRRDAIPRS